MMSIDVREFGSEPWGASQRIVVECGDVRAVLSDFGARLLELHLPDRRGDRADVVLGYPDLAAHRPGPAYFGATCGRYANRIRRGEFSLDGTPHRLTVNEGKNHLHGGTVGFDQHNWTFEIAEHESAIVFRHVSPHGDQGFPGELSVESRYTLSDTTLDISMTATTTAPTVVTLVNHAYWNLAGHDSGDVLEHDITIESDFYTPVDDELLPTGEVATVQGTPFDLRRGAPIGALIRGVHHDGAGRAAPAGFAGYDHNWAIRGQIGHMRPCISVHDPTSGRRVELSTDQPALQFYTGGYLDAVPGKRGAVYQPFQGFTLETQAFPDSPNIGHFPSVVLRPGETYRNHMHFVFSWD